MKKSCTLILNTRQGYAMTPIEFPSVAEAVRYARATFAFAWRIFVGRKCVKRGYGEQW